MADRLNRRDAIRQAAAVAVGATALASAASASEEKTSAGKGRIKQSIVQWCFQEHWEIKETIGVAKKLGCQSVELVDPKYFPLLKENGLVCAIASTHPFKQGPNNRKNWDMCRERITAAIDACAEFNFPSVITFTGYREDAEASESRSATESADEHGAKNCVEFYKSIIGYAEKKKVNLCLEMLNTRDDTHPMKGHPGYQGDNTEYCIDIIKKVGSARMKLLFDIYHVQIMDGDVIRRIRQHKDYLGHIHTAGNPGRAELDDNQEINYPPILRALLEVDYDGYVGQEFIPTGEPFAGLQQAVKLCDV